MSAAVNMIVSDLDGTLLSPEQGFRAPDLAGLVRCGDAGIVRVVATGRTLYSARRVLPSDFPIDYLAFSSGAGILDWRTGKLLQARALTAAEVEDAVRVLHRCGVSFMVHEPIPENHRFRYHDAGCGSTDFRRRCELYREFAIPFEIGTDSLGPACQALAIAPPDAVQPETVQRALPGLSVIRATSPLDGQSVWIEVFPQGVSKGSAAAWLAAELGLARETTLGLGNDYNDLGLLEWTAHSYVVANAPAALRARYCVTRSNREGGLSAVLDRVLPAARS